MKTLYTAIIIGILGITQVNAQCMIEEVQLDQRVHMADAIIEGNVISKQSYWDQAHGLIYTVNTIEIFKSFKGVLTSGKIELLTQGGIVGNRMHKVDPSLQLNVGQTGIFFLETTGVALDMVSSGLPQYQPYASVQGFVRYDKSKNIAIDPFKVYNDIEVDIYGFIQAEMGRKHTTVQAFDVNDMFRKPSGRSVPPVITSFTPTTITAGTMSVLTINGSNFGSSYTSSANIWFSDCNNGGSTLISVPASHIQSWSDTQIQVWVSDRAGTGPFRVTNPGNESTTTTDTLTVTYNITQLSNDSIADLINDSLGGYVYTYNKAFSDSTAAVAAFERALETWRCATFVNLDVLDTTTTIACQANDGVNSVSWDNTCNLSAGVLGTAYSYYLAYGCGAWYVHEMDIKMDIQPSAGWYFGANAGGISGQSDFESVALHEVGHNHQLGHVIDNGAVMHYSITSGTTARVLNPGGDVMAGDFIVNRSIPTNACGPGPMTLLTPGNCSMGGGGGCTLSTTASGTNVSCNSGSDGTATVTPSGAQGTPTYAWNSTPPQNSQTATNLPAGTYIVTVTDTASCQVMDTVVITEPGTAINISFSPKDVQCNGDSSGSVLATVTGGVPNYSYNWNTVPPVTDSFPQGLSGGTYVVTVTDANSCVVMDSVTINEPSALVASIDNIVHIDCFADSTGSANVHASGGTPGYSFTWNSTPVQMDSTAVGLPTGFYTVTVLDANTCQATDTVTINQNPNLTNFIFQNNASTCGAADGNATSAPSGGLAPYTYSWSTVPPQDSSTAINLAAGGYNVTVTDSLGCSRVDSITITEPNTLALSPSLTQPGCPGYSNGSITVTPSGGTAPYTYLWSTSDIDSTIDGLMAGTYSVTVTDSLGCMFDMSIVLNDPTAINLSVTSNPATTGNNDGDATVTATGGTPPYSYQWSSSPTDTDAMARNLAAGTYMVTVTDMNGCMDSISVDVSEISGIGVYASDNKLLVYPNPASDQVTVELLVSLQGPIRFEIWSVVGKQVQSGSLHPQVSRIGLADVTAGHYFLRVISNDRIYVTQFTKTDH
jgi:hypothetical protein